MEEEIWKFHKNIPGLLVSNLGNIMYKEKILEPKIFKGYYYINILGQSHALHRLVAESFIPNYLDAPQVNHIDGDKSNNKADNLEWVTIRENILHALETNLRKDRYPLTCYDKIENKTYDFRLLRECADFIKVSQDALLSKIKYSYKYPIHGRYILKANVEFIDRIKNPIRNNHKPIWCYDHVSNILTEYISSAYMAYETGMNTYTIREACGKKYEIYYIGGYTFSYNKDFKPETILKFKALRDRLKILKKGFGEIYKLIEVYDYRKNQIVKVGTCADLEGFFRVPAKVISDYTTRGAVNKRTWLLKGYGIRHKGSLLEWHPYTEKEVICSMLGYKLNGFVYKLVKDSGETSYYTGFDTFALMFPGVPPDTVKRWIRKKKETIKNYFKGVEIHIL